LNKFESEGERERKKEKDRLERRDNFEIHSDGEK
jgi:hypothetical protein